MLQAQRDPEATLANGPVFEMVLNVAKALTRLPGDTRLDVQGRSRVMSAITVEKMRQHITHLCERKEINIEWCTRPTRAWAQIVGEPNR